MAPNRTKDDEQLMLLLLIATLLRAEPAVPDAGIQQVVATIAQAAKENVARPENERAAGDALADLYVRRACQTGLPARTIVLGVAYALEPTGNIAANPFASAFFQDVETAEARKARWATMGKPTLRGRQDWLSHFVVSAGLAVAISEPGAELLGIQKEVSDALGKEKGTGSGFSFSDLNADLAGIAFARWMTGPRSKEALAEAGRRFQGANFIPDAKGLPDGLAWSNFTNNWGGLKDSRFQAECERLRKRVNECKGYGKEGA
jgi:hypothetical protein